MAKRKRGHKSGSHQVQPKNSDDEEEYAKENEPDKDDASYYYDEVDQFHMEQDKILLDKDASDCGEGFESDKEEVLAFDDDDSDEEDDEQYQEMKQRLKQFRRHGFVKDLASDIEDEPEKKPDKGDKEKAWGSVKSRFYGGHESDIDEDLSDSEPEAAQLEEEEALAIQKRLLQEMDEGDIGLEMFTPAASSEVSSSEKITKDLTKLSQREKKQLLKKQSPELLELIEDYKMRVSELQSRLLPVYRLIKEKKLSKKTTGAAYVNSKVNVYLNYLVNFGYYLMLKAKQTPIEHHPVIRRILQYRNIMKQTDVLDARFKPALDQLLEKINQGDEPSSIEESSDDEAAVEELKPVFRSRLLNRKKKTAKLLETKHLTDMLNDSDLDEADPSKGGRTWGRKRSKLDMDVDFIQPDKTEKLSTEVEEDLIQDDNGQEQDEAVNAEVERRGINYQIEKNKGLTMRKRKENRNPRVKNRLKYRKAKIRRRGQVREVRKEIQKYGGEISGIRAGMKKSIKFKS